MSTPNAIDLTTVSAVQGYLGGNPAPDPNVLQPLITAASKFVLNYISRNIAAATYTNETYNGTGTQSIVLRQGPIISVAALKVDACNISAASSSQGYGYLYDDTTLYLIGGCFSRGLRNVEITYSAGYADGVVTDEPVNVPSTAPYTTTLINGGTLRAITTLVYSVGGTALVRVAANPAAGQYTLNGSTLGFAAADQGAALKCSYTTNGTPEDLNQAVVELVGWKFAKRSRLDKQSETLQQQTVSFSLADMPESSQTVFDLYKRNFYTP